MLYLNSLQFKCTMHKIRQLIKKYISFPLMCWKKQTKALHVICMRAAESDGGWDYRGGGLVQHKACLFLESSQHRASSSAAFLLEWNKDSREWASSEQSRSHSLHTHASDPCVSWLPLVISIFKWWKQAAKLTQSAKWLFYSLWGKKKNIGRYRKSDFLYINCKGWWYEKISDHDPRKTHTHTHLLIF